MPRGKEPSWPVQKLIFELVVRHGDQPQAIQRSLDVLIRQKQLLEDTPGTKWIEKTIRKLQELDLDVLAELPPSVWKKRYDYETIKDGLERLAGIGQKVGPQPDLHYYEHWARLGKLAEELKQSLELPKDWKIVNTYFGLTFHQSWYCHEGNIYFSTQNSPLWECLLQHLDNEFEHPRFSYVLKKFQQTAAQLLNGKPEWHPLMARSYQLAQSLSYELWVVIERGTFIGTCDICKEWDCPFP